MFCYLKYSAQKHAVSMEGVEIRRGKHEAPTPLNPTPCYQPFLRKAPRERELANAVIEVCTCLLGL